MMHRTNTLLIVALCIGLAFHGSSFFFTLESTYDALIHLFFADHYANSWFEPWDYRWYTGFTVQGYPPLVHQSIALLAKIGGLKFGMFAIAFLAILLFITGAYRFALVLIGNRRVAGYTALLAVFSSTFIETLHLFGQLPSIIGLSILLHSLPEIYLWLKTGANRYLATSLSLIAVTVCSHHVTPIFGMVFFIFPLIGLVLMDSAKDQVNSNRAVTLKIFLRQFKSHFKRILVFGLSSLALIIVCILPYWINSKKNPITQVPIPHGSRDNFLEVTSSGLVFFLIPWGILLFILPYIFYRFYSKRYLFFGLSFSVLALLGTGGTTPIPRAILGETAFHILTLDRFTLWATIIAFPLFGEFVYRFVEGDLGAALRQRFGSIYPKIIGATLIGALLFMVVFTMSLGYFRPSQPQKINMQPIVNFLHQDQHDQWRYLPLGFGDQMAWLSAQTNAMTVDGNYHSARRLPELTTRAVERLENSKYRGVEGIGSLQQFLTVPEKYNLKYVFSNDKFYDPLLYFCGWQRLQQLENGIMVWERLNVKPLPKLISKEEVPLYLKLMWGILPVLSVLIAFVLTIPSIWLRTIQSKKIPQGAFLNYKKEYDSFSIPLLKVNHSWAYFVLALFIYGGYTLYLDKAPQRSPEHTVKSYYDALDFKAFQKAHALLVPDNSVSLDQYMLQVAVSDGILSSYAKLDSIGISSLVQNGNSAHLYVHTTWITPFEKIKHKTFHNLSKVNSKWFLHLNPLDNDLPPDQLIVANSSTFYNQGRRRVTTQQTHHEDILEQPLLEVLTARLVQNKGSYSIVGELQNVDKVPADVSIKASLFDKNNTEVATYDAQFIVKHKLMPKETTSFRIDFEGIAWSSNGATIPSTFNPDEFTPVSFSNPPVRFNLQCSGNVATADLYKQLALQNFNIKNNQIRGTLFNGGIQEVTIPQVLISYYDTNKELLWVDYQFVREGVRVQRKQTFEKSLPNLEGVEIRNNSLKNCFVNGLPNISSSSQSLGNSNASNLSPLLQQVEGKGFRYLKVELNQYIGNPN